MILGIEMIPISYKTSFVQAVLGEHDTRVTTETQIRIVRRILIINHLHNDHQKKTPPPKPQLFFPFYKKS